ncbi:MAG: hypothetical protein LH461_02920 [Spirochaetaceae bacterium]|nr:hypothetical protein [Spirochaetaceae bacterium]
MQFSAHLAAQAAQRCAHPDRGDIVLSWLTRLVVIFGLAGVVFFDAISVGVTATTLSDQGNYAARDASEEWQTTKSVQKAYDTAVKTAVEANPLNTVDPVSFRVDDDNTVHLTISREATTLVLYRWSRTAGWAQLDREAKGKSVA